MTEEERIRKLEEIVIKLETFLETMFSKSQDDHNNVLGKVLALEKFKEDVTNQMHTSCELKSHEIDNKISKAMDKVYWMLGSLVLVFIGAVVYFNNANSQIYATMTSSHSKVYDRIAENNKPTIENTTNIKVILTTLNKIDEKLDDIHSDQALKKK